VWDDHNYGKNDAESEFIGKNQQRQLYFNFLDEPRDLDRYTQVGTPIYQDYLISNSITTVHMIRLDCSLRMTSDQEIV